MIDRLANESLPPLQTAEHMASERWVVGLFECAAAHDMNGPAQDRGQRGFYRRESGEPRNRPFVEIDRKVNVALGVKVFPKDGAVHPDGGKAVFACQCSQQRLGRREPRVPLGGRHIRGNAGCGVGTLSQLWSLRR